MKSNNQHEGSATLGAERVRDHQIPAMRLVYKIATVFFVVFLVWLSASIGLANALGQTFPIYAVLVVLMMSFTQLNHIQADHLYDLSLRLKSCRSEMMDYLRQQMNLWRQLFFSSLLVNQNKSIFLFGRLPELPCLTQLPHLSLPLAFRS